MTNVSAVVPIGEIESAEMLNVGIVKMNLSTIATIAGTEIAMSAEIVVGIGRMAMTEEVMIHAGNMLASCIHMEVTAGGDHDLQLVLDSHCSEKPGVPLSFLITIYRPTLIRIGIEMMTAVNRGNLNGMNADVNLAREVSVMNASLIRINPRPNVVQNVVTGTRRITTHKQVAVIGVMVRVIQVIPGMILMMMADVEVEEDVEDHHQSEIHLHQGLMNVETVLEMEMVQIGTSTSDSNPSTYQNGMEILTQ
jgi:hypothetical protein